jgi:DNA-binding NtrC family response regulator
LRERREDIPALILSFAEQVRAQNNWKAIPFSPEAVEALQIYSWPGNVRELRNIVERLMLLATDEVSLAAVRAALPQNTEMPIQAGGGELAKRVQSFEREAILAELKRNHNHITNTARALGLERSHLYKKAEQVGIDLRALRQQAEPTSD